MQIEHWPVNNIKPYDRNPRLNDTAVSAVASSIREYGFRQPIVVDGEGVIVVGHTRWKAALKLGMDTVPVHVAAELSPEQARAYRIADNQTASIAEWDNELLAEELKALEELGLDIKTLGFDDDELQAIFAPPAMDGLVDPDDVPEPPEEATTKPGDLWILGEHRLLCGDSAKPEDVDRLVEGKLVDMINADPPYGVKVEPRSNNAIAAGLSSFQASHTKATTNHQDLDLARDPGKAKPTTKRLRAKDRPLANDFVSDEEFDSLLDSWFCNFARFLKPGGSYYIWGGYANLGNYPAPLKTHGLYFSQAIVWDKQHPVLTRKDFMGAFEIAFYGWREGAGHHYYGPNNATDLWHVKKVPPQAMTHLTQKPNELAQRAIEYSSKPGDTVLDLFGGSGSTLIACEITGRRARLMEIDTLYCDVIVQRWESFTGKKAVRADAGVATSAT